VYTPNKDGGPFIDAKEGDTIRVSPKPPWIVVDHAKETMVFTNWPGTLWYVEVIKPAPSSEQITKTYTRASAVRVIKAASTSEIFGPSGKDVEAVLCQAAELETVHLDALKALPPTGHAVFSEAWNRWLAGGEVALDHSKTLSVGGHPRQSPVGPGFSLLFNVVLRRATELEGDDSRWVDEEGEFHFTEKWQRALDAALHAAMAAGTSDLMSESELRLLTESWRHGLNRGER
jgi:hypothetical protein